METLRYPTLAAWAKDTCDAIREKDGTSETIDHQDVPDRIRAIPSGGGANVSGVTAQPENVSENVKFVDANGILKQGTMPENEAQTVVLDGSRTVYDIPEGHHPEGGKVRINTMERRLTPSSTEKTYTAPSETVYTKIILDPIPDIYRDVSGADAEPGEVLSGAKFIGASGELETGEIDSKTGKQGTTVVSNGNKYIDKGYHDGTSYIAVNVPQEITSGEDSTSCTAAVSDVAQGKTFRSGGYLRTGTLPAAELPAISMSFDETDSSYLLVKGSVQIPEKSIAAAGQSTSGIAFVPKYKGATSVTPGSSQQTLSTAGKYVESDIVIGASSGGGECYTEVMEVEFSSGSSVITVPLSKITNVQRAFVIRSEEPTNYLGYYEVLSLSIDKTLNGQDYIVMATSENWTTAYLALGRQSGSNFVIDISSVIGDFYGSYRCYLIGT